MKTLLTAILLTAALAGCNIETHDAIEIFPGQEAAMVAMCTPNGGFKDGRVTEHNSYVGRYATISVYRNVYEVNCINGAKIEKTVERRVN